MSHSNNNRKVVRAAASSPGTLSPTTSITIAVDTAYIASQQGQNISQGVYLMDNQRANGSTGEGTTELSTVCHVGSLIGFLALPINASGSSGDQVVITGFTVSQGSVFGSQGIPVAQPMMDSQPASELGSNYWIGQAMNTGSQTYQVQLAVTVGQLRPTTYFINWDPFIKAQ
ncbi:MAG TPA: hypothetical protein VF794_31700 [Archangium sp.]|jgi:hypothetical protein|uniref:hypothetical protein n=1 Tax=Archangium sp. TaxID=1872627 RepID=UPI002ED83CC7